MRARNPARAVFTAIARRYNPGASSVGSVITMPSLYCLLARDAETGVIFRRGPSTQTLLIHWDLTTHCFTPGQWFKGRIYERRSDLSPDGPGWFISPPNIETRCQAGSR
jgi:hypothetical protein